MTQTMKRMTACLMALVLSMAFTACTPPEVQPTTQPTTTPTSAPATEPTSVPTSEPAQPSEPVPTDPTLPDIPAVDANLELEQLRMPGYDSIWTARFADRFGGFGTVQNASELADFVSAIGELGKDMALPEGYDDAFFADHYLLLIPMQSTSGSIRYEAEIKRDADKVNITVVGKMPEVGTTDMADWLILIPISRTQYPDPGQIEIDARSSQGRDDRLNIQDK